MFNGTIWIQAFFKHFFESPTPFSGQSRNWCKFPDQQTELGCGPDLAWVASPFVVANAGINDDFFSCDSRTKACTLRNNVPSSPA
jgi:hypothetical protein